MVPPRRILSLLIGSILLLAVTRAFPTTDLIPRSNVVGVQKRRTLSTAGCEALRLVPWKPHKKQDKLTLLEEEVLASVQEKLDVKRVFEALRAEEEREIESLETNGTTVHTTPVVIAPRWKIAFYAASAVSLGSFVFHTNAVFAATVFAAVFLVANRDPTEEDDLAGPVARIVGRSTIRSVEASQPKIRALVRALVTGEEAIITLNNRVAALEEENAELKRWKEQREQLDRNLSTYTSKELRDVARARGLKVGGTKKELAERLAEADNPKPQRELPQVDTNSPPASLSEPNGVTRTTGLNAMGGATKELPKRLIEVDKQNPFLY